MEKLRRMVSMGFRLIWGLVFYIPDLFGAFRYWSHLRLVPDQCSSDDPGIMDVHEPGDRGMESQRIKLSL